MNPFFEAYNTPFNTYPFDKIKNEHFVPAIEKGIEEGLKEIEAIKNNPATPNFENTIEALENSGALLDDVTSVLFNLNSAETNDEIQSIAREVSPKLTAYSNDIILDQGLFERVKAVYDNANIRASLNEEQEMLISKSYKSFVRNGANLNEEQKQVLRKIDEEKSQLSLQFGENVLKETTSFEMIIDNKEDLSGIPDNVIEMAAMKAEQKGLQDKWVFTLDFPSYIPFVTYADNRELRKEMLLAYGSRAFKGNENDNQAIVKRIATLRQERAELLGFKSHADFILQERMAGDTKTVIGFLNDLLTYAKPKAQEDIEELKEYMNKEHGVTDLKRWDFGYYSEKLKKAKYNIDTELLKPYFQVENCMDGIFTIANKLYNVYFEQRTDIPVYHEDVVVYEVKDKDDQHVGIFYVDLYPREGKRNGAWKTAYKSQRVFNGQDERPHIAIVCNFPRPTKSTPALLSLNDVTTLFHEFGHALHGLLTKCTYASLSGTSVYWDFVELPSQIMENWVFEKECLDLFAKHYETGELIPEEYVQRIKDSANFHSGYACTRQISLGKLDMAWHTGAPEETTSVGDFEKNVFKETDVLEGIDSSNTSCGFSHIFQGGYSAGYYSYKWAEVLDADAFETFQEEGIFNTETAKRFLDELLARGGSKHPMDLYKAFKGKEPSTKALLKRSALI